MKFSCDRKYLATGGEDGVVNIWKVRKVTKEEWKENMDVRIFEDQPFAPTRATLFLSISFVIV